MSAHILPAFDSPQALKPFFPTEKEPWETLPLFVKKKNVQLLLGVFPLWTQLERSFSRTVRTLGVPVLSLPSERIALVPTLVRDLPVGKIVATSRDLPALERMSSTHAPMRDLIFHIVLTPEERPIISSLQIVFEVHLVPGAVGLFQCEALASKKELLFHLSSRFYWEFEDQTLLVTDDARTARFSQAPLPLHYKKRNAPCPCGHQVVLLI